MRQSDAFSARGVVLAAVFCVLSVASGCGRETFDLLAMAGAGGGSEQAGGGGAGSPANQGGGAGLDSSAGASTAAGAGGLSNGGRPNQPGGGNGGAPCLAGSSCMDGAMGCPVSLPLCTACTSNKDCPADAQRCDLGAGRCVQCERDQDCPDNQACNIFTQRCARACREKSDCIGDSNHPICHTGIGVCVSRTQNTDCAFYDKGEDKCYFGSCVECFESHQCPSNSCVAGRCDKMH